MGEGRESSFAPSNVSSSNNEFVSIPFNCQNSPVLDLYNNINLNANKATEFRAIAE